MRHTSKVQKPYCLHTCVVCGILISHYRTDCAEKEAVYASHPDCRDAFGRPVVDFYSAPPALPVQRDDAHLGAVEGSE